MVDSCNRIGAQEPITPLPPLPAGTVVYLDGQVALDLQRDESDR